VVSETRRNYISFVNVLIKKGIKERGRDKKVNKIYPTL